MLVYTLVTVFTVDLLAAVGDVAQTWTHPTYYILRSNSTFENPLGRRISEYEENWISWFFYIGAVLGALPTPFVADKLGRKTVLLCTALPHAVAYLMFAFAKTISLYYAARIVAGFASGAGYSVLPSYIAEISEDSYRGALVATLNIAWNIGRLIPFCVGYYLPTRQFNIILAAVPVTFFIIFLLNGSESPHYLVRTNKESKAETTLMRLRSNGIEEVAKEITHIKGPMNGYARGSITEPKLRYALTVSLVLMVAQQVSGIRTVTHELRHTFEVTDNGLAMQLSTFICGACILFSSVFSAALIEKIGRKLCLTISFSGNMVALTVLGVYCFLENIAKDFTTYFYWIPLVAKLTFVLFYNFGAASVPWVIFSELFPYDVKAVSATLVSVVYWVSCFVVSTVFVDFNTNLGDSGKYFVFSVFCLYGVYFSLTSVPETKGQTFDAIQQKLEDNIKD
ncbi:facilitated trehalose transporter Tret1-like [Cylas formicarius]|uniref:facilitated trehalose transporter Tret1-like n=1 Tax=Cylas formicarius TaxID=197179 RepID=UPI0029584136|nr:facilitated trehalose transporter Tret1-like [Cylas formicarius]